MARTGRPAQQPDPLLAALAHDPHLAAPQVEGGELGRGQLADPQTRGVRGLDERPVAQGERHARCARSVSGAGGADVRIDDREEPLDLVDLEDAGQAPGQARRGDGAPRVAVGQALRVAQRWNERIAASRWATDDRA